MWERKEGKQAETISGAEPTLEQPSTVSHLDDLRMPPGATLSIHELEAHMAKLIDPATGQFPMGGALNIILRLRQISRRAYKSSMNSKSR